MKFIVKILTQINFSNNILNPVVSFKIILNFELGSIFSNFGKLLFVFSSSIFLLAPLGINLCQT